MKRKVVYLSVILCVLAAFTGCKSKKNAAAKGNKTSVTIKTPEDLKTFRRGNWLYAEYGDSFDLDYTACEPEPEAVPGKISTAVKSGKKSGKSDTTSAKEESKNLSDYKIKYNTKRTSYAEVAAKAEKDDTPSKTSSKELTVIEWGPENEVIAEMTQPVFFVTFSEPVKELAALGDVTSKSDVFSITPEVEGAFHWRSTNQLTFECEKDALSPAVEYKISVNKNLKALSGHKITGETEFTTKAEKLKLSVQPGVIAPDKFTENQDSDGYTSEALQNLCVTTNTPLTEEDFKRVFVIQDSEDEKIPYTVSAEYDSKTKTAKTFYVKNNHETKSRSFISYKNLISLRPDEDEYTKSVYLHSLELFRIESWDKQVSNYISTEKNAITITFNQYPDKNTLGEITVYYNADLNGSMSVENKNDKYTLTADNIKVSGKQIRICNIPFKRFGASYEIYYGNVKDIFGQKLNADHNVFIVPKASSFYTLCDTGRKIMEAQFPHRLAFAYQNLNENGWWRICKAPNPLYRFNWDAKVVNPGNPQPLSSYKDHPDQQVMEYAELDSLLDDGYGWIDYTADYSYDYYDRWNEEMRTENSQDHLLVQVTDLGVTARLGINKAVVMVRTMSTNKPVADAKVIIYEYSDKQYTPQVEDNFNVCEGTTDKNGFAVIDFPESIAEWLESANGKLAIYVESGKDKVTFAPTDHCWSHGLDDARIVQKRTFIFTDRKLYKPGETVTFRGIDKNQHMGHFTSYKGKYRIQVTNSSWREENIIYTTEGETTSSGGFYGSFTIPEDAKPEYYDIKYFRPDIKKPGEWDYVTTETIDIRFFEPTKLQMELSTSDVTNYGGSSVNVDVHGTYLAGGAISGGQLDTSWYKERTGFSSSLPEAKGYSFGPQNYYSEGRNFISEENSALDSEGNASVSLKTDSITNGSAYVYTLEAAVTDVSNEESVAKTSVIVHPAKYYIGLNTPYASGFPEKGKKLDFAWLLVTPEDQLAAAKAVKGDLSYVVNRNTWEVSNSNGINDDVYSSYHKVTTQITAGTLKGDVKGTFSFTPEKSGEYELIVKGKDSSGNLAVTEYEFYVTGSDSYWFSPNSDGNIDLVPDQNMYNPGDTAKILLKSALPSGDYLITVEREGIFTQELKHLDSPSSVIEIPVAMNYLPYAYVCVASYSTRTKTPDHQFGEKDMDKPKGFFGKTKIHVNPYVKAFSVQINTDKKIYRPGDMATVTLKATKGGKPLANAELTVMGVDRSVIDLINYHVPNPIDFFYNEWNFMHCVTGGDSRNMLMDPVTYAIKNLQGGDSDEDKENQRKDFRPTAFFEPALITDEKGEVTCTFKVPSQLTTFRVTAFGVNGELFALQEDEFGVRNPVNAQSVQPRLLRERDTAECGVVLTNLSNDTVNVKVAMKIRAPEGNDAEDEEEGLATIAGLAEIDGETEKSVTIGSGESTVAYFNVAAVKEGKVNLVYKISSEVLNETLFSPLKIEKTFTYESVSLSGASGDDKKTTDGQKVVIPGFADSGEGSLSVTLDATRLGILKSAINYVFDYPYGCIEQRTSRALPLVIFGDYLKVFGMNAKVTNPQSVVKKYFNYIAQYQKENGGFGYWPSSENTSDYVSARVLEIYYKALEHGYSRSVFKADVSALERFVLQAAKSNLDKNYARSSVLYDYYVISSGDSSNSYLYQNDVSKLYDEITAAPENLDQLALLGLTCMSYSSKKAQACADLIKKYLQANGRGVSVYKLSHNDEALAHTLKLFVQLNKDDPMVDRLLFQLLTSLKHGYWTSTRQTAAALDAVYTYIKGRNLDDVSFNAQVQLAGITLAEGSFKGAGAEPVTEKAEFTEELKNLPRDKELNLEFSKDGNGTLYYSALLTYALPDELQNFRDEGININYEIYDEAAETKLEPEKDSKVINLESGKTYRAKITISTAFDLNMVALRAPVPSGAAILDAHFANQSSKAKIKKSSDDSYWWRRRITSQALYDNEGQFFWDNFEKGSYTMEFLFRANRRGVYPCPPVQAECMYEPEVFGRSDGYLFVIK